MKYLIDFDVFEAAMEFAAKDDVRFYLNGVHLKGGRVESTNGHIAYMAKPQKGREKPEYLDGTFDCPSMIISPRNKLPAKTKKNWPVFCSITVGEISRVDYLDFYGKVLSSDIIDIVDGKFPNIPRLFSKHIKGAYIGESFGINTKYLALFDKIMKRESIPCIKLYPMSKNDSIMVEFRRSSLFEIDERAIVMPVRL